MGPPQDQAASIPSIISLRCPGGGTGGSAGPWEGQGPSGAGGGPGRQHRSFVPIRTLAAEKPNVRVVLAALVDGCRPRVADAPLVVCKITEATTPLQVQQVQRELEAMRLSSDTAAGPSRVVPLLEAVQDATRVLIVMPYYAGGDLMEALLQRQAALEEEEARRIFADVLCGLLQLKAKGIAHGDVSLENVLLDAPLGTGPRGFLTDLGSSMVMRGEGRLEPYDYRYRGKLCYAPPEVTQGDPLRAVDPFAVDVWALGLLLYALLTGHPLFLTPSDDAYKVVCDGRLEELLDHYATFGLSLDPLARELVCSMLRLSPSERPTLQQVLDHPWVEGAGPWPLGGGSGAAGLAA